MTDANLWLGSEISMIIYLRNIYCLLRSTSFDFSIVSQTKLILYSDPFDRDWEKNDKVKRFSNYVSANDFDKIRITTTLTWF